MTITDLGNLTELAENAGAHTGAIRGAVDVLVLDLDGQRTGDHAPDVEEAEAAFVLLVDPAGLIDDAPVEQGDHLPIGGADQRGALSDVDLRRRKAHALGEIGDLADPLHRGDKLRDHRRASSASGGRSKGSADSLSTGSPSWAIPS